MEQISQELTIDPFYLLIMHLDVPEAWAQASTLKIKVAGEDHRLKKFRYGGRESWYVVKDNSAMHPKIFVPSAKSLPAEVKVASGSDENDNIEWEMVLGGKNYPIAETLVVADQEPFADQLLSNALRTTDPRRMAASNTLLGIMPLLATLPAVNSTGEGWHQPGDTITMDNLLTAYKFIYPDELSQLLLNTYLSEGHHIELGDVLGDYDFDYLFRLDNKASIQIENDDAEMNPAIAAQYLWRGLNEALANVYSYRAAVDENGNIDTSIAAIELWRPQVGEAAAMYGTAAAELYLAGISIIYEPLDWVIMVNDVAEGHYSSLVGALPFIPAGIIKGGRSLRIVNQSGATLEVFADAEKLAAAKSLYGQSDLRVMGVTMEEKEFSAFLRKALANSGGPVPVPKYHGGLRNAMIKAGGKPKKIPNPQAHHDFPWKHAEWFAERGIDVNNPAFGRWVTEREHVLWEKQIPITYEQFWDDVVRSEVGREIPFTYQELLQKLAEARTLYPVMSGQ